MLLEFSLRPLSSGSTCSVVDEANWDTQSRRQGKEVARWKTWMG